HRNSGGEVLAALFPPEMLEDSGGDRVARAQDRLLAPGPEQIRRGHADRPLAVVLGHGPGDLQALRQQPAIIPRIGAVLGQVDQLLHRRAILPLMRAVDRPAVVGVAGLGCQGGQRESGDRGAQNFSSGHALPFMMPALTRAVRIAFKSVKRMWSLSW